jgi:hypothetical protein
MAESKEPRSPEEQSGPAPNPGRRRLMQGGLGSAPLLMTLVSRPVLGQQQCFSPSGFVSMPTSQHGNPIICRGRTPGYWKQTQHFNAWPCPYRPVARKTAPCPGAATPFFKNGGNGGVFTPAGPYASMTFLDVLNQGSGPPHNVGRHIVAALLNAKAGLSTVVSIPVILGIWTQFATMGFYEPTAGVQWDHNQITAWLESTMPA